jgi:hypothetical protein
MQPKGYSALVEMKVGQEETQIGWIGPPGRLWKTALTLLKLNAWEFKIVDMQGAGLVMGQRLTRAEWEKL